MYLMEQNRKGERFVATLNSTSNTLTTALSDAEEHFRRNPETVALYLYSDDGSYILRTYIRSAHLSPYRFSKILNGYHEWPAPPTMYPGRFPTLGEHLSGDQPAPINRFDEAEVSVMLERADRKGYERGFKVGIAHRNKERAAMLRRQADSLERNLPGSVYAGVRGFSKKEMDRLSGLTPRKP